MPFDRFMVKFKRKSSRSMQSKSKISILVALDQTLVREGMIAILNRQKEFEVVAQTNEQSQLIQDLLRHRPSVLIMDRRMEGTDTIDVIKKIRDSYPSLAILIISESDGSEDIYRALRAGGRGYVLKDSSESEVIQAVRAVHSGRRHISPPIAARLAERMDHSTLTPREMEVLQYIVKGKSNKEIADTLNVTEGTVKYHINGILSKLGVSDRTQAATAALLRGIIHPHDL